MKKRLIAADLILTAALVGVFVLLGVMLLRRGERDAYIVVRLDGENMGTYALSEDRTMTVGGVEICIQDGRAFAASSDCPDKVCVHTDALDADSFDGASIVCLPNRVSIVKQSKSQTESGADTVAG